MLLKSKMKPNSGRGTSQFPLTFSEFKFQLDEAPRKDQALSWSTCKSVDSLISILPATLPSEFYYSHVTDDSVGTG